MFAWLLLNVPTGVIALLAIGVPVLAALAGVKIVRATVGWQRMALNNEEGGILFSAIGTIYAIFLAFMVVVAWDQLSEAEKVVAQEAATVVSLYRDAAILPAASRPVLRGQLRAYVRALIDHEWRTMAEGGASDEAQGRLDAFWATISDIQPQSERETVVFSEAYSRLNELSRYRELRILASQSSIEGIFWVLLLGGALATVGFTYLIGMDSEGLQLLMTGILTAMLSAMLFLIIVLDLPFTGDVRVEPGAFERALVVMTAIDRVSAG